MSASNVPTRDPLEQPVLVPLDGSEIAERALRYAALIPSRTIRLLACAPITLSAARKRWALGEVPPDGGDWLVTSPEDYLELVAVKLSNQEKTCCHMSRTFAGLSSTCPSPQ